MKNLEPFSWPFKAKPNFLNLHNIFLFSIPVFWDIFRLLLILAIVYYGCPLLILLCTFIWLNTIPNKYEENYVQTNNTNIHVCRENYILLNIDLYRDFLLINGIQCYERSAKPLVNKIFFYMRDLRRFWDRCQSWIAVTEILRHPWSPYCTSLLVEFRIVLHQWSLVSAWFVCRCYTRATCWDRAQ